MTSSLLDKSLDDIIKQTGDGGRGRRGRGRGRGGRGGHRGGGGKMYSDRVADDDFDMDGGDRSFSRERGGRGRGRGRGRGGRGRGGSRFSPYSKKDPDAAGSWEHDLYDRNGGDSFDRRRGGRGNRSDNITTTSSLHGGNILTGAKIKLDNLNYSTSSDGLRDLFSEFGTVKKARVHFNTDGRSSGEATVVMTSRRDAELALNMLRGKKIDGRPVSMEIVEGVTSIGAGSDNITTTGRTVSAVRGRGRGGRGRGRF